MVGLAVAVVSCSARSSLWRRSECSSRRRSKARRADSCWAFFLVEPSDSARLGLAGGVADADLDAEALGVVGPALGGEDVLGLAGAEGLKVLLESGLVVADGSGEGVAVVESGLEGGQGRLDYLFFDEAARGGEAAVEVEGGDDGFKGVGEQGGLATASTGLLSAAEADVVAEADAGGDVAEMTAADEGGAETGELALAGVGEAAEEGFGCEEAEDGVADELKLLVIGAGVVERMGLRVAGVIFLGLIVFVGE